MFRRELLWQYSELRRERNFPGSKLTGFAPAVFGTQQRSEFPGEQMVRFLLRLYSKYIEHQVYSSIVSRIFL
jgi:hypothetical protein